MDQIVKTPGGSQWNTRILQKYIEDDELGLHYQANTVHHKISYNFAFGLNYLSFVPLDIFLSLILPTFLAVLKIISSKLVTY